MGVTTTARLDEWLRRFEPEVPLFARRLLDRVEAALADPVHLSEVREEAEALGVLRAQQGHAVAGLVEDLLTLRELADGPERHAVVDLVVDVVLRLAVSAYVTELTDILGSKATRDPLTGMPNRAAFEEALAHEIAAGPRTSPPALLLIDLDKFKAVNDTNGHLAGDAVLVAVAELLAQHVRPTDVACRLGGDEFAVVLPRTTAARAVQVAKRLLVASRKAPGLTSEGVRVTFSMGVGWLPGPADNAALVALADAALYDVKALGGDDVAVPA
jgi:diguanylate cyclase (GGDEF)-like protein